MISLGNIFNANLVKAEIIDLNSPTLVAEYYKKDVSQKIIDDINTYSRAYPDHKVQIIDKGNFYTFIKEGNSSRMSIPKIEYFHKLNDGNISKSYHGQRHGNRVHWGEHIHCDRLNGPTSNHFYYKQWHPQAWVNFLGSDCDIAIVNYYGCGSFGKAMNKCDGLNVQGRGVQDCSRSLGKPQTAWFKN